MESAHLDWASVVGQSIDGHDVALVNLATSLREEFPGTITRCAYPYDRMLQMESGGVVQVAFDDERGVAPVRIDGNVEKHDHLIDLMARCFGARLTRLDLAVDYRDRDLSDYFVYRSGTSRTEIYGRSGRLETVYLGRRGSDRMLRFYDKGVEDGTGDPRVRVELQMRGDLCRAFRADLNVLDGYTILDRQSCSRLSVRDRLMVAGMMSHPEWAVGLRREERKRLLDLAASESSIQPSPCEVVGRHHATLCSTLSRVRSRVA